MVLRRKSLAFLALLLTLSLVAAACGGDGDDDGGGGLPNTADEETEEAQEGGTVVFGAEQEPAILNTALTAGNLFWGNVIVDPLLPDAYRINPDFTYSPDVLTGEAEVTEDPFTITYSIKPEAQWSDGTPISSEDFEFTWQTYTNEKWDIVDRTGYDSIESAELVDEKTITFTFKEAFAPYKEIFDDILPKHVLEGENFNKVWNNDIPISGGPFMLGEWKKGSELTVVRNDNYWGEHLAYLDEVVYRFLIDTDTEIQALRGGEVDMIYPQPQPQLSEVVNFADVEVQATAGTIWEHLDFQFKNPALAQDYVRQAIAHGIDRQAVVDTLIKPLQPDAEPLNNLIFMSNQEEYEPHFDIWNYDPDAAIQLLEDNGCTKSGDVYECEGEPLEFEYTSTAGNVLREQQFEIIQAQLKDVGIKLTSGFASADIVFGKTLSAQTWDLFNFAWVGSPDPVGNVEIWSCKGSQNYNDYCNEDATALLDESNRTIDPAERSSLFNQADALMAEDLPVLPLYQKPTFLGYYNTVHNLVDNATNEGPTWNMGEWWIEQ